MSINTNGLLEGKVAVITGASRGIGEAIAIRYAMEGAKVVVSARTVDDGDHILPGSMNSVVQRINDAGGEAAAIRCDMALAEDQIALIAETEKLFGGVDILVNNAAVTYFIPIADFPDKREKLMFEVQVHGPVHLAQLAMENMRQKKNGWILNISSHAALHPEVDAAGSGGTVYGMCKAALERFSTGLASEVNDHNIRVNAISPGLVATPGVVHHGLVNDTNKDRVVPVENMAEACLRLVHDHGGPLSGRITYADVMLEEFSLAPADLI